MSRYYLFQDAKKCIGCQSCEVACKANKNLPVGPKKRMTYVFDARTEIPDMPLTIDVTGLACRPEGTQYLSILSPPLVVLAGKQDDPPKISLMLAAGPFLASGPFTSIAIPPEF